MDTENTLNAENILKDIEKETKEISKWGNKKVKEKDYLIAGSIMVGIVFLFFIYVNFIPKPLFNSENKISMEIIEITADNCKDCFDVQNFADSLINDNINVKSRESFEYNSEKGKELINKYNLKQIPALIITSNKLNEIEGLNEIFLINGKNAIFDKAVPYIDLNSGNVKGLVTLKEVYDSSCKDCASMSQIKDQFEKIGIKVENYETIDSSSIEGQKLIKENDLTFLPNLLVTKDITEYWWAFDQIKTSFDEKNNYYALNFKSFPYREISTNQIKGIVDINYISDKTCEDCFNVTQLKGIFQNLGIFIGNEEYFDISTTEGKNLLSEYNITAVPTVILSKEIQDYNAIKEVLKQAGSFEKDEVFVFRKLDALNAKYKKL
jgi:hypothetical protein